jgi:hypothetical protein
MGGIGDYSGCTVLQMPIKEGTFVALQVRKEKKRKEKKRKEKKRKEKKRKEKKRKEKRRKEKKRDLFFVGEPRGEWATC